MARSRQTRLLQASVLLLTGVGLLSDFQLALGQRAKPASSRSTVQRFIKEIQSSDRNELRRAYTTLRQIGPNDKGGVPLILEALKSNDKHVRSNLGTALARIGPAAIPHLVEAVDHSATLNVRLGAISALGNIHAAPDTSVPCLVRALSDDASGIRRASVRAIQRFGKSSEAAIPKLSSLAIEDSDDQVRIAAVTALGHLHLKPDTSVPCLILALSDESAAVRRESVVALAQFGSDARPAVAALRRAVDDGNPSVQMESLKTIAALGPTAADAVPTLLKAMLDEAPQKSRQAALGLRRIGITSEEVVDSLLTATEDASPHVRHNAVWVLAASGESSERAVPRFIELLKDEDETVVRTTLRTLGEIGPDAKLAIVSLIEAAKSDNRVVQALAEQAFRQVAPDRALEFLGKPFDAVQTRLDDIKDHRVGEHDWPQLGGSRFRNNTPAVTHIPTTWNVGEFDRGTGNWLSDEAVNIKWVAKLGSQSYGNIVVANGRIYVGTNNGAGHLKRYPSDVDLGCLLCFRESDGKFLWQHSSEKLPTGRVHDWPLQGICSSPAVEGDRLWFVTNRGEVVCLDTEGFYDEQDDGPETGVWGRLFEAAVDLRPEENVDSRGNVRWGHYPNTIRALLASAGRDIPSYINIRRDQETDRWIVVTTSGRDVVSLYELVVEEATLRINSTKDTTQKVLQFEIDVLAGIAKGKLSPALRAQFIASGIELPEHVEVRVAEPSREWDISAVIGGVRQTYRLREEGQKLSCHVKITTTDKDEADVVWKFNMMSELGVSQHNMATCSPTIWGDTLFICTSNGLDESHVNLPAPDAPSFTAMDKNTGKVLWTDNSPGKNILHGQWSCPVVGVFDGVPQVMFPGGDGWLYSFRADRWKIGKPELVWKFDANPKESKWILGGRGTRNNLIAVPVIYDDLVYAAVGQDPEHGEGEGLLWCIDPTKRGDVSAELVVDSSGNVMPHRRIQAFDAESGDERVIPNPNSAVVWHYDKYDQDGDGEIDFEEQFHRTISSPTIKNDLLIISDFSGLVHCLNAKTGIPYWTSDLLAACWGTPLIVEDKVFVGDEDGDIAIFNLSPDSTESVDEGLWPNHEVDMGNSVYQTPIVANNILYIANKTHLFAIETKAE